MGFGLLLIGYFTATVMALNMFGGVFGLIGYTIALFGIKKLCEYNGKFLSLLAADILMIAVSAVTAFSDVTAFLYRNMLIGSLPVSDQAVTVISYVKTVGDLVLSGTLCFSVLSIARQTGERKISYTAIRNFVVYCLYFVLQAICQIPTESVRTLLEITAMPVWALIFYVIAILLNVLMIFSCYSKICDENDVDMPDKPKKPSRFAFINELREEKEKRMKKALEKNPQKEASAYSDEQIRRSEQTARKKKKNR